MAGAIEMDDAELAGIDTREDRPGAGIFDHKM
jgi:hypothetical protein